MKLEPFTGPGSTPSRRRFWDKVAEVVFASQKVAGDNVTVDEHQNSGTVINVPFPERGRAPVATIGACCYNDGTCDDLTEADCNDAEGNWQGPGTTCADDPNPCLGACCEGEGGTTCVEDSTPDSCADDGGTFQDFGSTCDPNPCGDTGACCFPDGSCSVITSGECSDSGGIFQGGGSDCDSVTCNPFLTSCPSCTSVDIEFIGIQTDCGCIPNGIGGSFNVEGPISPTTGTLSGAAGGPWTNSAFGTCHYKFWASSTTCSGTATIDEDRTTDASVECGIGGFIVVFRVHVESGGTRSLFVATPSGFPLIIDNNPGCTGSQWAEDGTASLMFPGGCGGDPPATLSPPP